MSDFCSAELRAHKWVLSYYTWDHLLCSLEIKYRFMLCCRHYLALCRESLATLYYSPQFSLSTQISFTFTPSRCLQGPKDHLRITPSCFFRFCLYLLIPSLKIKVSPISPPAHPSHPHGCFSLILIKPMISVHIILLCTYYSQL